MTPARCYDHCQWSMCSCTHFRCIKSSWTTPSLCSSCSTRQPSDALISVLGGCAGTIIECLLMRCQRMWPVVQAMLDGSAAFLLPAVRDHVAVTAWTASLPSSLLLVLDSSWTPSLRELQVQALFPDFYKAPTSLSHTIWLFTKSLLIVKAFCQCYAVWARCPILDLVCKPSQQHLPSPQTLSGHRPVLFELPQTLHRYCASQSRSILINVCILWVY